MRNNVVLIDFENVQPESLDRLTEDHFRIVVFVGAYQTKLPFDIVASLQKLGSRAEYVKISGSGSNALDFHIAYCIGAMSAVDPTAFFHIVSKDTGYDPLIQYLRTKKILADRVKDISEIPVVKSARTKSQEERVRFVIDKLAQQKAAKPGSVKTLTSSITSLFQKQLPDDEVAAVIAVMEKQGIISVAGTKVTYARASGA
ncbi:MAG: hypothetical protein JSS49_25700 [Planctomycetes bacterium]|nr:hypothetical protein [Planctomycetota bacterium]